MFKCKSAPINYNNYQHMFQQDLSSIVIDLGSSSIKMGYSGEDGPKFFAPSFIGDIGNQMVDESIPKKHYIGDSNLNLKKKGMEVHQVYSQGQIKNFENYQNLVSGMLSQEMRIDPSNFSLLLSEDNIHNRDQRQKIASFVFETLNVKNMFFSKTAVLSCFATGRSTAAVVDCGADMSSVITVHDGFALSKSIKRVHFGGELITKQVQKYIETDLNVPVVPRVALQNPEGFTASYLQYHKNALLRDIKETLFKIDQGSSETDLVEYELPDKNIIKLDRTKVNNIFLNPPVADSNFKGLHHLVHDNINQCDVDVKKQLYGNMVVTGGNSLLSGLTNKLQTKVAELAPANVKLKLINFPFAVQRRFAPWIGGSILTSLSSFQSFWVGQQEWKEHGSVILDKKCA